MNVYFCDVCGVRVTDVDLHAGHGMRRRNDVICAACIDLGHGKEWVENHAQKKAPALAGAVAGGSNGHVSSPPPRPVELIRDRVRTLDEDEPASPVKPVSLPAAAGAPEFDDTAQVPVVNQELSSMAAGFAALTPPKAEKSETDEDDIEELPPPKLDESGGTPVLPPASPFMDPEAKAAVARADTDADDQAGAPSVLVGDDEDDEESDPEKSETAASARVDESDRPAAKAKPSTARSKTSSSRISKAGKSSRAAKRPKNNQQQMMLISIASMALIVIFGGVFIATHKGGQHTGGEKVIDDVGSEMGKAIADAKSANKALGSHDLAKLQAALDQIQRVRQAMMHYESVAKSHGWSDDQISQKMESYGAPAVISLQRALMYEIEQVKAQQH